MNRRLLLASLLASCVLPAAAQRASRTANSNRCAPVDTAAAWYRAQHAWFDDSPGGWTDDGFRVALLHAVGMEAMPVVPVQMGVEIEEEATATSGDDADVRTRLRALTAQRGSVWPTRSVVGGAGTHAVWLLAARDSALAPAILKRMMEAGPDESPPADVATLEDRLRLFHGRKQLYATQMRRLPDGSVEPLATEDLAHVDLRREGATLPPLAVSRCVARRR